MGALFHEPGAIARHDAVAWGYGRGADRRGVEIHQETEVTGIVNGVLKVRRGHLCDVAVQNCGAFINNEACIAI